MIIDDLKRLERAGNNNSRATEKLIEAAKNVANLISDNAAAFEWERNFTLESGRTARYGVAKSNPYGGGYCWWLTIVCHDELYGGEQMPAHCWGRLESLQFAQDIADGLLPAIGEWLESRTVKADAAAHVLSQEL